MSLLMEDAEKLAGKNAAEKHIEENLVKRENLADSSLFLVLFYYFIK